VREREEQKGPALEEAGEREGKRRKQEKDSTDTTSGGLGLCLLPACDVVSHVYRQKLSSTRIIRNFVSRRGGAKHPVLKGRSNVCTSCDVADSKPGTTLSQPWAASNSRKEWVVVPGTCRKKPSSKFEQATSRQAERGGEAAAVDVRKV
jgi:hypothetical protein